MPAYAPRRPCSEIRKGLERRRLDSGEGSVFWFGLGRRRAGVPGVEQKVGGILVRNTFEGEDADVKRRDRKVEEEGDEVVGEGVEEEDEHVDEGEEEEVDEESEEEEDSEEEDSEEEEAELAWEDVFPVEASGLTADSGSESESEARKSEAPAPKNKGKSKAALVNDDGSDTPGRKKEPRMKTNKKKATNFFTTANVKNRNRDCKTPKAPSSKAAVSAQLREARGGKGAKRR
ncbi:unnamed protein product [Rhizoctonia solani]|nr:unnamed protein product [Rhizoctonia solani]